MTICVMQELTIDHTIPGQFASFVVASSRERTKGKDHPMHWLCVSLETDTHFIGCFLRVVLHIHISVHILGNGRNRLYKMTANTNLV